MYRNPQKSRSGMTLVELLASISVLAILGVIVFYGVNAALLSARRSGLVSNLRNVHAGLLAYASDHNNVLPATSRMVNDYGDSSWQSAVAPYVNEVMRPNVAWYSKEMIEDSVFKDPLDTSLKTNGAVRPIRNIAINGTSVFPAEDEEPNPMGVAMRHLDTIAFPSKLLALTTGIPAEDGDEFSGGAMRVRAYDYQTPERRARQTRTPGEYYCVFVDGHLEIVSEVRIAEEAALDSRSVFFDTAATNGRGWHP